MNMNMGILKGKLRNEHLGGDNRLLHSSVNTEEALLVLRQVGLMWSESAWVRTIPWIGSRGWPAASSLLATVRGPRPASISSLHSP